MIDDVQVTDVPAQTGLSEAEIVALTGRLGFTSIETTLDVAGLPVTQTAFELSTQ
jgi:hypothetical protein